MKGFILGLKENQSQRFTEGGKRMPITSITTSPCYLVGVTSYDSQGYVAIKVGFGKAKQIAKPQLGELKKAGITTPLRFLREARIDGKDSSVQVIEEDGKKGIAVGETKLFVGQEIKPSLFFKSGDLVHVVGTSRGKGFQGVVKRHGFAGGPKTHGQSDRWRAPGAIGQRMTPGRVFKGLRMAGRTGGAQITVQNLEVVESTDAGLTLQGIVPGKRNSLLQIVAQ